jgi:hypothetical protein
MTAVLVGSGTQNEPVAIAASTTNPSSSSIAPIAPETPGPEPVGLDALAVGIDLGVVVRNVVTGEDVTLRNEDEQFESASLVKILIALDALDRGEPTSTVVTMLAASDDDIANLLWTAGGEGSLVPSGRSGSGCATRSGRGTRTGGATRRRPPRTSPRPTGTCGTRRTVRSCSRR